VTTKDLVRVTDALAVQYVKPTPVSTADMAWMAGVIDLKGAVVRKNNKTRKTPQVVLYVNTKNKLIAERLSALTGTAPEEHEKITAEDFLRRNCAEHCTTPHVHVGKYDWHMPPTTRWSLTGIAAAVVLANLAPFMSTYGAYAGDVAEVFGNFAAEGKGSGAVRSALSRLSLLGWQMPPAVITRIAASGQPHV
jgi:hypothetical protein